jgi:hypothetical protein
MTMYKLGLDIHGVITDDMIAMRSLAESIMLSKVPNEVHIISGPPVDVINKELESLGFVKGQHYSHIFSIVDYHLSIGTPVTWDDNGHAWTDEYTWDKTKADYCLREAINLHIDDSDQYGYFFKTPYARFFSKNKRKQKIFPGSKP